MTTLITGADGYLGAKIAQALLAGTEDHLVLGVRAAMADNRFADKRDRIERMLAPLGAGRITVVPADLRRRDALREVDPRLVQHVIHAAAVTRFNVEREDARADNLDGTARVAEFASRCDNLKRLTVLSTLYVAGRRQGDVFEVRLGDSGFVNHYEWSKWAAEDHVWQAHGDLPCTMVRLPTIISEDDSGGVVQQNAFHNTLKVWYYGLLSLVPGDRVTPINVASAEFAVAAIMRLLDPAVLPGIYHACPAPDAVTGLGSLTDTVFDLFERSESYRRRKLMRPMYCDEDSFYDLVKASSAMRGGPIYDAVMSVAPFARQLYLPKAFRNGELLAAWPGYKAPDPLALIAATTQWLVETRWGRQVAGS